MCLFAVNLPSLALRCSAHPRVCGQIGLEVLRVPDMGVFFVFLETWGLGSTSLSEIYKKTLMNINNINKTQFPVYIYIFQVL